MRKKHYIFALLFIFICSYSHGQDIIGALSKVKVFDFGNGRQVATYEDVSNINIQPRFDGCSLPVFNYSDLPSSPIKYTDRNSYLNSIIAGALIPTPPSDGLTFLQNNFYLDFGYMSSEGWVPRVVGKDGSPNMDSQNPGRSPKIWYCLTESSYSTVRQDFSPSSLGISADAVSCKVAQNLCPLGKDNCSHLLTSNNVIKNLQSTVRGKSGEIEDSSFDSGSLTGNGSGIFAQIVFKDRTPPWIEECKDNRFPTIGENSKIYTGDWFVFDELKIKENDSSSVKAKVSLGKIDHCPKSKSKWIDSEDWENGQVQNVVLSGDGRKEGYLSSVISPPPNNCYGYMRYTVFAQDYGINSESKGRIGNLNPGCASIREDDPSECYGLPNNNPYYEDLLSSPGSAKPWPYRANRKDISEEIASRMSIENISGKDRVHEGFIKISDNDYPNILIKLTSAKYGEDNQIFFPPCIPDGELTIINSPDYDDFKSIVYSDDNTFNQSAYNSFVGDSRNILKECNYKEVKNSRKRPYFTIIDLIPTEFMSDSDIGTRNRFLNNVEPDFVNKHFRLEDQTHSDTDANGRPDTKLEQNNESLLGKRNGTWKEVVALVENLDDSEVQIQEDVEYQIGIWVDDSVKWANSYRNSNNIESCESILESIPSGIVKAKIKVDIPNQVPPYEREYNLPVNDVYSCVKKSVDESVKIVFREPTVDIKTEHIKSEDDLIKHRFPSITVEATDYAGNTRKIKLYFRVKDENAKIKTLQRRHQQY